MSIREDEFAGRTDADEVERLLLLVEASGKLLGSPRLDAVLPAVIEVAQTILAADAYALWLRDLASDTWNLALAAGLSREYQLTATAAVADSSRNVQMTDAFEVEDVESPEWVTPSHREAYAAEGIRSLLALPLWVRGGLAGTLVFYYLEPHRFEPSERRVATALSGVAASAIATAELVEGQLRTSEERRFVVEASEMLSSSLDYETTLKNVAALAVPRFADWCAVDLLGEDGKLQRLAVAHADPEKVRLAHALAKRYPQDLDTPRGASSVVRSGESQLVSNVADELLVAATVGQPELLESYRELGLRSVMIVPLTARGRTFGALTFVSAESGRRYGEGELALAESLGRSAALAVDNARLLRAAERNAAELDALLGTAPVGIAFWDRDLRYVRVNDALAALNGTTVEEHLGRTPRDVLGGLGDVIEPILNEVLRSGRPELERAISWGTRHWIASYYPVKGDGGDVLGVGGVSLDITERKRGERVLRFMAEASALLASTLDVEETLRQIASLVVPALAGQCIVDLLEEDGSTRCVAVAHLDPKREELLRELRVHYPPAAEGHPVQAALRTGEPQLLPELTDEAVAAMAQSEEHREQIRVLGNTSGIVVPLVARGRTLGAITLGTIAPQSPYRDSDVDVAAELARRAAVAVDNARLYRAAEERAQAALALAYVGDGVALVDNGGVVRLWNRAAEQLTGIEADELVGRVAAAAVPGWSRIVEQVPVESGPSARSVTLPLELGGRELWLSISAVEYPEGTVYAFRDLTEERVLERMRSDFVSTVSHELRTPLAAIYGAALTLRREDLPLPQDQRSGLLDVIASESDRLARIVNDILWASRVDARTLQVTLESCDVGALVADVVAAARLHLPAGVKLDVQRAPEAALASCDADKLRQVLTNLVDNAVKYSPDGGRVEVTVSAGERVRIAVLDEGLGIPLGEQARIFEKFYRLDPNLTRGVGGTGLGLYICRELVQMMDGTIWVVSREGAGSTFTVELKPAL